MSGQTNLLTIDIGNTNIVIGVYRAESLVASWRLATEPLRTRDEYAVLLNHLCELTGIEWSELNAVILSSVVPSIVPELVAMCEDWLSLTPHVVRPAQDRILPNLYRNPEEVGSDRIVNAYAAVIEYGGPLVIVDFGTATTFCAVSEQGEYLGGAIVPGLHIASDALFRRAAKLPRVEVVKPPEVIARTTVQSIQSGLFYGYVDMIDGMVARMKEYLGASTKVVATGGLAKKFEHESKQLGIFEPNLTLKGLYYIYHRLVKPGLLPGT